MGVSFIPSMKTVESSPPVEYSFARISSARELNLLIIPLKSLEVSVRRNFR